MIQTVATYTYDDNGNRKTLVYGNGIAYTYNYNNANLLTSMTSRKGTKILQNMTYTYYLDGNMETKTDVISKKVTRYVYDGLGRLKSETETGTGADLTRAYEYDNAGNRKNLTVTGAESYTRGYQYDSNNRLLYEDLSDGYTIERQYDNNGNMTMQRNNEYTESYTYSPLNRLTRVSRTGTEPFTATYTYKADGLRASKLANMSPSLHIWDGNNLVGVTDNTLSITDFFVRGNGIIKSSKNGYYLNNAHGDVVGLAGDDGVAAMKYDYEAFGNQTVTTDDTDTNPFRYCGEYFDAETGNVYLRNRYYDTAIGRFISEDPARSGGNWYVYCLNNPVTFVDPLGLDAIWLNDQRGALYQGHASALIQDEDGDWYHVNFGPHPVYKNEDNPGNAVVTVIKVAFEKENFSIEDGMLVSKKDSYTEDEQKYNSEADKRYVLDRYFDNKKDTQIYIEGDFIKSLEKARDYEKNQPAYVLTTTNCAWIALEILQKSYDANSQTYKEINDLLWKKTTSNVPNSMNDTGKNVTRSYIVPRTIRPNSIVSKLKELWQKK